MNEVMMLPKWQAAASILLVFIIAGRTQGKCKVLVLCQYKAALWSYSKIWSDGYGNDSEKGVGGYCGLLHSRMAANILNWIENHEMPKL